MRGLAVALFVLLVVSWVLFVTGCAKDPATFIPTPRGTSDGVSVSADAIAWVQRASGRGWAIVAPTGSMEPVINQNSVLLWVTYSGQPLRNGAVVVFDRSDAPNCVHVVCDQTPTHVYMSGYANRRSDGWFPKTTIKGIVVGQLYLP